MARGPRRPRRLCGANPERVHYESARDLLKVVILIKLRIETRVNSNYISRARVIISYTTRIWEELERFAEDPPPCEKLPSETRIPLKDVIGIEVCQRQFSPDCDCARFHSFPGDQWRGLAPESRVNKLLKGFADAGCSFLFA